MRVAVVGHVEWVQFARVERVPEPGEIVSASEVWEEPAGGGAVAAVQLLNLNGSVDFFTSLGDDELGQRSRERLTELGVTVHAADAGQPQRRAFTYVDENGERTITVLGPKLRPSGEDPSLPWEQLSRCDAVYFTGGDIAAVRARATREGLRRDVARARDAPSRARGARRARRQRGRRGRALRRGRARSAAAAHRQHSRPARRMDPAGRPVPRSADSRATSRTRTAAATASPPDSPTGSAQA